MNEVEPIDEMPLDAETEARIDDALARAAQEVPAPKVVNVYFEEREDRFVIAIDDGSVLSIPRSNLQDVAAASVEDARCVEPFALGMALEWPKLDAHFSLEGLREGCYGNKRWMEEFNRRRAAQLKQAS